MRPFDPGDPQVFVAGAADYDRALVPPTTGTGTPGTTPTPTTPHATGDGARRGASWCRSALLATVLLARRRRGALALLAGCAPPEDAGGPFAGVSSVAWDGGDGLVARWDVGSEVVRVEVSTPDGTPVASVRSTGGEGAVTGLADGEYVVRVARVGDGEDGGAEIRQLVGANRVVFRSFVDIPDVASVWGDGDLVVLGGRDSGASFYVFDVSDATEPLLLATVEDRGYSKETKFDRGIAWIQVEGRDPTGRVGARGWDLADPTTPSVVGEVGDPVTSVHTLWAEDGFLYLTDNLSNGLRIYDVEDPAAPVEVVHWLPPGGWVHDEAVVRGRLYVSHWDGFTILDVADPRSPVELGTVDAEEPRIHNAWPTDDDRYVFVTSEIEGGHVTTFDVSGLPDIARVGEIVGQDPLSSVHNVHVRGRYLFAAWYGEGLVVFDVSDPLAPREVGRYDTLRHGLPPDTVAGAMHGAWEVWPYGEHVVVSDKDRGLFVFDFFEEEIAR